MKDKLNIKLAYDADYQSFKRWFPELTLITEEDFVKKEEIDLLIFSGGEDVSPEYYMDEATHKKYARFCGSNPERDKYELRILRAALNGELKVNKIIGICRGVQFLNVMFGGVLYPDINTFGIFHAAVHGILHACNSKFREIKIVNSYHHQGVRIVGGFFRTNEMDVLNMRPKVIAVDEGGDVKEIICWDNRVLGMQFHPEYWSESYEDKQKIKEIILKWISDSSYSITEY